MNKKVKTLAKFAIGLGLLVALFAMADLQALRTMLPRLTFGYAALGMLVFITTGVLDMWRIRLASPAAQQIPLGAYARMNLESYLMVQFLPGHMGMDAYRIATIGNQQRRYAEPAFVVLGLRLFSLLIIFTLSVGLLLSLSEWRLLYWPYILRLTALPGWEYAVLGVAILLISLLGLHLLSRLWRIYKGRLNDVAAAYRALTAALVGKLVLLSLMIMLARVLTFVVSLYAFAIDIEFLLAASIALIATLAWLLPLSPAGIGVREGVITGLLVWLGVGFEPALMVALLNRTYFILLGACGGISLLLPKSQQSNPVTPLT